MTLTIRASEGSRSVRDGAIVMSGGYGAPETLPGRQMADMAADILRDHGADALQYGPEDGYLPLRRLIADWLSGEKVEATAEDIIIVTGSKQTIDICARIFCPPGTAVLVTDPSYVNGLRLFRANGTGFVTVPGDERGMDVDALERLLARADRTGSSWPRLIYCIPDFNNPDSAVLSEGRREKLVGLATRYGIPILEDNPYRWLRFEGTPALPLKHFDREGVVISAGTFSKILAPGLRLGWVHAKGGTLRKILRLKADGGSCPLTQMLAYEFYRQQGSLERHLGAICETLRAKRDALLGALAEYLSKDATWNRPAGGKYVWARFREGIDTDALAARASTAGVSVLPGSLFYGRQDPPRNEMRICFSFETPERIRQGVSLLAEALDQSRRAGT